MRYHLAIDIGASSGRHILGHLENGKLILEEIHRFVNSQVRRNGHDCWDMDALVRETIAGLNACAEKGIVPETLGIDTWGVDFVLVNAQGEPCSDAVAYRDARTEGMDQVVESIIPFAELYAKTGVQKAIFNTIYQLTALRRESPNQLAAAERFLMIPDYLNYKLTGVMANEYTDATTTSLVNARTKSWDLDLLEKLGLPTRIFKALSPSGTILGGLSDAVLSQLPEGLRETFRALKVVLPACHDTGSAYLAVPARDDKAVYLSSGTWSILGVENPEPVISPAGLKANFSNEGGWNYRFRYLKNIMGLWMIQSIRRQLNGVDYVAGKTKVGEGPEVLADWKPGEYGFGEMSALARQVPADYAAVVDATDKRFFAPDSMIDAVRAACREKGLPVPGTIGEIVRCVYSSLAQNYAQEVKQLSEITGKRYTSLNIVGGGCQDAYLNELTQKATGLDVYAGPIEGTSIGNLIVQILSVGELTSLEECRNVVRNSFDVKAVS